MALAFLALAACGNRPTVHDAMKGCTTQLNAQTPNWRSFTRNPRNAKMRVLVARYMSLCMQDQHFKLATRCSEMDERCYTREPRFWERL